MTIALATLLACAGDNPFVNPGDPGTAPEITSLGLGAVRLSEADTFSVQVSARGSRALTSIQLRFRGAFAADTTVGLSGQPREINEAITYILPTGTGPDSVVTFSVTVVDAAADSSALQDTTFVLLDATPPTTTAAVTPTTVGSGEILEIAVTSADNRGLRLVGYEVTGPAGFDTLVVDELDTPALTYANTFELEAPNVEVSTLEVRVFAEDIAGLETDTEPAEVALVDKTAPTITSFLVEGSAVPVTVALRDSIDVQARISDQSGFTRVAFFGEAVVGDTATSRDVLVARFDRQTIEFPRPLSDTIPLDTIVKGRIGSQDVTTKGPVVIYVEAEDAFGNVSLASAQITVGGPLVQIISPAESATPVTVPLDEPQDFTIRIFDAAGIDSARIAFTGAVEFTSALTLPAVTTDTFTVEHSVDMPSTGGLVTAQVRAWSADDVLGVSGALSLRIQDLTGPVLSQIRVNESSVSGGPTVPLGDSVLVEADVSDISGIESVKFVGFALVGDTVLFEDEVIVRFDERTIGFPRAFSDTLPKTSTVRTRLGSDDVTTTGEVRLLVTASDSLGNTSEGTFDFNVGGPSVVITDPDSASVTPLSEPTDITVRIFDPAGIDSAQLIVTGLIESTIDLTIPAVSTDTITISTQIPATETQGSFTVRAIAWNANDVPGESDSRTISVLDEQGPVISNILVQGSALASTVPLGDSVLIEAFVADPSRIRRVHFVGQAVVGDEVVFRDELITRFDLQTIEFPRPFQTELPRDTTVRRRLGTEDNTTTGPVRIFIVAEDSLGNESEATYDIFIGGPSVRITFPPEGQEHLAKIGDSIDVRISIYDPTGLVSASLVLTDALDSTIVLGLPALTTDTVHLVQNVLLPVTEGAVRLQAFAENPSEIQGSSGERVVQVLTTDPPDIARPIVTVATLPVEGLSPKPRLEFTDTVRVTMSARDEGFAGLERMGLVIDLLRADTVVETVQVDTVFATRTVSEEEFEFIVPLDSIYTLMGFTGQAALDSITPDTLLLEAHAFAVDTAGNVACSVGIDETRTCEPAADTTTAFFRADVSGLRPELVAVRGRTIFLDNPAATIADLAIDPVDDRVFLSNVTQNLVELLQLDPDPRAIEFLDQVQVGSRPWGLFIGERVVTPADQAYVNGLVSAGDTVRTLIVANSGGTNLSLVHLDADVNNVEEVDTVRVFTLQSVVYEIEASQDEFGNTRYSGVFFDFTDRPQYIAQDSLLRMVFATVATEANDDVTARYAITDPDPTAVGDSIEVRFFLNDEMVLADDDRKLAIANVDSIEITPYEGASDTVRLFTHEPGYPGLILASARSAQFADAAADLNAQIDAVMTARGVPEQAPLFHVFLAVGAWDFADLTLSDTVFISASGDRGKIALGEGAKQQDARVFIWHGEETPRLSTEEEFDDLIGNAAEEILGLGLNFNGSLGVVRGREATYFFTPDLRLQGIYQQGALGGSGATFHQDHNSAFDGGHHSTEAGDLAGAAFTGTSEHSVEVVNTFHFNQITELFIRDNVAGPLRAGPPLALDNQGLSCATGGSADDPHCIVVKLYGITNVGGVVVMNVRRMDLE